jgi:hypothetical protein
MPLLLRDVEYLDTYGCYSPNSVVALETNAELDSSSQTFQLLKLSIDSGRRQQLHDVPRNCWSIEPKGDQRFDLFFQLDPGYYLLLANSNQEKTALPIVVSDQSLPARVAVIRPVFTQWSYHSNGFYFNQYRAPVDRVLRGIGSIPLIGRLSESKLRRTARKIGIRGVDFPYKPFPAHEQINLAGFYRRNSRWNRLFWDAQWGSIEGIWIDEILSGMPIFSLLGKHAIPFHVYTDIDLHDDNPALETYDVLVFSGQEGMTSTYYSTLTRMQRDDCTSFLLWGVQGFGYRQLDYDRATGILKYVGTRGLRGLWGDRLDGRQPDWEDEANLFGFHFPEPDSSNWRYDRPYSKIVVSDPNHAILEKTSSGQIEYAYSVRDLNGEKRPGLTWAGGEFQERIAPDAKVIAHLDNDSSIVGIGEYKNTVLFSPTYLPAYFAYQTHEHPEIESWFLGALDYLLERKSR